MSFDSGRESSTTVSAGYLRSSCLNVPAEDLLVGLEVAEEDTKSADQFSSSLAPTMLMTCLLIGQIVLSEPLKVLLIRLAC